MNYVKEGWDRIKSSINSIEDLYSIEETRHILKKDNFYLKFVGKAKNRTMMKYYPKLFQSIYVHTKILEDYMAQQNSYKWNYNFVKRMDFILNHDCNIESLKCVCGKKYTWTQYCRHCPEPKKTWLGKKHTKETKLKMRNSTLTAIHSTHGQVSPRYNKSSIRALEQKAAELGIDDLIHAENGGEFQISGYFLDGYSPSKNIVIEYDERHHFDSAGNLRKKDIIRQQEIEAKLGCTFIRIIEE